jgi:hypothetical protein
MDPIRPWHVVLLAASLVLAIVLARAQWNPLSLAHIGTRYDPGVPDGTVGLDGQFVFQIAVSPLDSPAKLDVPAYRLQRILYPMVARALAAGNHTLVPWTLILVNLAALTAGVAATEAIMVGCGRSRWWALAYGLNVGMFVSLRLDLTEPLAYGFVQWAALAQARNRPTSSAVGFCLAALTKEVTLLIAVGYLIGSVRQTGLRAAARWAAIVLAPFAVWQIILAAWLGHMGIGSGGARAGPFELLPFHAWWGVLEHNPSIFLRLSLLIVPLVILPVAGALWVSALSLWRGQADATTASLAVQSAAFLFLPASNLLYPLGITRFSIGLIAALLNFGAVHGHRRVLLYSQLWLLTMVFVPGDLFLPYG